MWAFYSIWKENYQQVILRGMKLLRTVSVSVFNKKSNVNR